MVGGAQDRQQQYQQGEEDDDYMGDLSLFLPPEALTSSSSSSSKKKESPAVNTAAPKPKKPKGVSWQEQRRLDRERKQLEEDDRTRANLDVAIPPSNIGFKMLRMMGYSPGSALGKDRAGRTEPVGLVIRRSRAGIGRETPMEERARKEGEKEERKRRKDREAMEEFGTWQRMQFRSRRVIADYRKAEAALARLENREEEVEVEKKDEEKAEEEEEEEEVITEEDLRSILMKLRGEHKYCLYCGFQYESTEDLEANCPGLEEEDH